MSGIIQESFRNALVVVLGFIFGIIFLTIILYLVYKFVLVNIDFRGLLINSLKKLFEPK